MVLTYRFWTTALKSDPSVLGKTVQTGRARSATVVGVLEPSVPYPAETEIIANIVTSPHHLSATMVTGRVHRMTELFGRLAPGADSGAGARGTAHGPCGHREGTSRSVLGESGRPDRSGAPARPDHIAQARTILLVLLAASVLVFIIACSNVANLILGAHGAARERARNPCGARRGDGARCGGRCWPRACCCAAPERRSAC